ncbi:MAG TPA: hypothetical protein VE956_20080 [Nodularia sp. (in: cyanobacteria)]|nr:hypothetical protein [Nodularia sp. (in: cyanobacteria)]
MTTCSDISGQLAALSAAIAALDNKYVLKSEKPQIIQDSVDQSYFFIMPEAKGYTDGQINIVNATVATISVIVFALQSAVALIQSAIAALQVLFSIPGRVAALEQRTSALETVVSSIANLIKIIQAQVAQALSNAAKAQATADSSWLEALAAKNLAITAQFTANIAEGKADNAIKDAAIAKQAADKAQAEVISLAFKVAPLPSEIADAKKRADDAKKVADDAQKKADDALKKIAPLPGQITNAKNRADQAARWALDALNQLKLLPKPNNGKNGAPGKQGLQGVPGLQGLQGIPGIPGAMGLTGLPGKDGKDGKPGLIGIPGLQGIPGKNGIDGIDATMNPAIEKLIRETHQKAFLIPALVARPSPLTAPMTEAAAAAGTCQTTRPGGCMNNLVNNARDKGINHTTDKANFLTNLINGLGIDKILKITGDTQKVLGPQLFDRFNNKVGVSTWLQEFTKSQVLDRALAVMTFAATVHNGVQLTGQIGQSLGTAIGNVLSLIGIKDQEGKAYNVGGVIGKSIKGILEGIVGVQNYAELSQDWAKANRIYQATTNVLSVFQDVSSTILNALEISIGRIGKIGNSLRNAGQVMEDAYEWMNPQPRINRVTTALEKFSTGASAVEQVTAAPKQVIDSITELQQANTEFVKALGDDKTPANKGIEDTKPKQLLAEKKIEDANSQGLQSKPETFDPD